MELIACSKIGSFDQKTSDLTTLDSKLANYQVDLVGQFARMKIEFAIDGSKCKRSAKFA